MGLPDEGERGLIMDTLLRGKPVRDEVRMRLVRLAQSERCHRFSGADLEALVREGSMLAAGRESDLLEEKDS